MKCIKEKCIYCDEDMWKCSCYRCGISDKVFKKDSNIDCCVDYEIEDLEKEIDKLKRLRNLIKNSQ